MRYELKMVDEKDSRTASMACALASLLWCFDVPKSESLYLSKLSRRAVKAETDAEVRPVFSKSWS